MIKYGYRYTMVSHVYIAIPRANTASTMQRPLNSKILEISKKNSSNPKEGKMRNRGMREKKKKNRKHNKTVHLSPHVSIINLNVNDLNRAIKTEMREYIMEKHYSTGYSLRWTTKFNDID